ncbi:unnamed protein product [Mytilus edulis]|uniref:Uncharacterized protein n=1 Tax=Mytilus edulis TaxID=6550 RepID=A0A8S3UV92_MYTED|nr:unnamed protein product [Mytilus edulis]
MICPYFHKKWYSKLDKFMEKGRDNATFALHEDLLKHCTEILGISIAERIGGIDGYNLLLGCVKSSLPFAFLNGASSYASFCVDLLHVHYTSGVFHTNMKQCLFTTPHKNSNVNFALDAQREMDHLDAVKGFRPRSTIDAVIPRMSIVDHFTDVQQFRQELNKSDVNETVLSQQNKTDDGEKSVYNLSPNLNFDISSKDLKFIIPVAKLITRVGALSLKPDSTPRNVYNPTQPALPESLLDKTHMKLEDFWLKNTPVNRRFLKFPMKPCLE